MSVISTPLSADKSNLSAEGNSTYFYSEENVDCSSGNCTITAPDVPLGTLICEAFAFYDDCMSVIEIEVGELNYCEDTDGYLNITEQVFEQGNTTGYFAGEWGTYTDSCMDETQVNEFECILAGEQWLVRGTGIPCPDGYFCQEGACILEEFTELDVCSEITETGRYKVVEDIDASDLGICMNIQAEDVVLDCQDHLIQGNNAQLSYAVYAEGFDKFDLRNCIINGFRNGIVLLENKNNRITNTYVENFDVSGLMLTHSDNNTIKDFTAQNGNDVSKGLMMQNSDDGWFENIEARNCSKGIVVMDSYNNTFKDVITEDNAQEGILISNSDNIWYNIRACSNTLFDMFFLEDVLDDFHSAVCDTSEPPGICTTNCSAGKGAGACGVEIEPISILNIDDGFYGGVIKGREYDKGDKNDDNRYGSISAPINSAPSNNNRKTFNP